jgi:hypothetical protein
LAAVRLAPAKLGPAMETWCSICACSWKPHVSQLIHRIWELPCSHPPACYSFHNCMPSLPESCAGGGKEEGRRAASTQARRMVGYVWPQAERVLFKCCVWNHARGAGTGSTRRQEEAVCELAGLGSRPSGRHRASGAGPCSCDVKNGGFWRRLTTCGGFLCGCGM